jgi:hypothetical protein
MTDVVEQPPKTLRQTAVALYTPPFHYQHGYIFDSKQHMVSDDGAIGEAAARARGWGRIVYMQNPKALQDEVGQIIADALNDFYAKNPQTN